MHELLDALWRDFAAMTPQAERIQRLLGERGERVQTDHIALRTYGIPGINMDALAKPFEALGWRVRERYQFDRLVAKFWQHDDPTVPKVYISELRVAELSPAAHQIVEQLVSQLPRGFGERPDLPWAGRPWRVRRAEYESLRIDGEYAAWLAAFGFRVNHFTLLVNSLTTFPDLQSLNAFLVDHGFTLDESGGAIKGSPAQLLEQSSTRADVVPVELADATLKIPSSYFEFVRRYRRPTGEMFHGFTASSGER